MGYGEGAVMGVPAHDERDFAFAKKYGLPIKQVIAVPGETFSLDAWQEWYADKQRGVCVNSGKYDGLGYEAATDAIAADLKAQGPRRQAGAVPPARLGHLAPALLGHADPDHSLRSLRAGAGAGERPAGGAAGRSRSGRQRQPAAQVRAVPEVRVPDVRQAGAARDRHDGHVRRLGLVLHALLLARTANAMVDARNDYWMPMDQYIGGIEHAVLHLLYARFWTKVMRDLGLVKFDEPFKRLFTQGMLTHDCYYREDAAGKKRWFYPAEIDIEYDDKGRPVKVTAREDGQPVTYGGTEKMSKSKNNVVEPRDIIAKFGADTARAFVMFAGPPDQSAAWTNSGAEGTYRFLRRLWNFCNERQDALKSQAKLDVDALTAAQKSLRRDIHANLKQADFDYARMQYNTVVSAAMKMLNALEDAKLGTTPTESALLNESVGILLRALYPVAPHITHALWNELGYAAQFGARSSMHRGRRPTKRRSSGRDRTRGAGQRQAAGIDPRARRGGQGHYRAGRARRRQRAEVRRRPGGQARDRRSRQAGQRGRLMRRRLLVALASAPLAACGFKLRGSQTLPIETIYLALPVNSSMGAEMSRLLRSSTNAQVVSDRKDAQAVFELLGETREREVLAINSQGRATEYQLRLRVRFRVTDKNAGELLGPTDLLARRDITFNESDLLAKESEESLLYRDMQSDLVRQMVNRLAAVRPEA